MSIGCIYKLTSPSGKVYIGQSWHFKHRMRNYKHCVNKAQRKLHNAVNKYGFESFDKEILDFAYTQEDLDFAEIYWISYFDSIKNGYNIRNGGARGGFTEKSKKLMSKNNWLKQRGCTKEYRQTMSKACSGSGNGFYGKKHNDKTKKILSKRFKGKPLSKKHVENIRKGHIGLKHSEESKQKRSESNSKYIYELTYADGTTITFTSLAKFCKEQGYTTVGFARVLNGRYPTYKGMKIKIIGILS